MSKIDLDTITSGYNLSKINANFQKVEDALNEEVLYRKGYLGEPNEMQTNLDMNGKQILNVSRLSADRLELGGVQVVPANLAVDPYNGTREALRRSYAEAGYNLVSGSFEAGGTLVNASDVLLSEVSGRAYSGPAGAVAPGTNPVGDPDWTPRTDETLRSQLSSNSGSSIIGINSSITLADYLLKGDGIDPDMINGPLNDVGRLQAAVNLWATDRTKWIKLGRSYDLTGGTIYVANPESYVPESQLVIFGGELKKLDSGYMFDKPLGIGQMESTGGLRFKGTRFLGPRVAGTYIINGHHDSLGVDDSTHIIRVAFEGCMGVGIQAAYARPNGYIQSITFDSNCVWRRWAGYIVDTGRLYDVQMINMRSEAGDAVIRTRDDDAPVACNGLIILGGNIEGNLGTSGPAINVGVCWGTSISHLYMELNYGGDIDCSRSNGFHRGLSIHGVKCEPTPAQLANPNYYPFQLGRGVNGSFDLGGNTSTGNLYNCGAANPASIFDNSSSCGIGYRKYGPQVFRKVDFNHEGFDASGALGGQVGASYTYSLFYCQDPTTTNPDEKAYFGAGYAAPTALSHPGVMFGAGSFQFNRSGAQVARTYGGVSRIVEILGWKCVQTGAPGTWREVVIMVPY